jgi:hypothetical protein
MYSAMVKVYAEEHLVLLKDELELQELSRFVSDNSSFVEILGINKIKRNELTLQELISLCESS